jgi:hypothetical protein
MSTSPSVAAVVGPTSGQTLDRQSHRPTIALTGSGALQRALGSGADWVWFLSSGAQPAEDALERLLAAIEPAGARRASLLCGMVVDEHGRPRDRELAAGSQGEGRVLLELVRQRLLPLRYATFAHCLVARDAFARHGLPDTRSFGPHAPIEWCARVLRHEAGYLVPASTVVLRGTTEATDRRAALRAVGATLRMTRTGAWTRGESLQALATLAAAAFGRSPHGLAVRNKAGGDAIHD